MVDSNLKSPQKNIHSDNYSYCELIVLYQSAAQAAVTIVREGYSVRNRPAKKNSTVMVMMRTSMRRNGYTDA